MRTFEGQEFVQWFDDGGKEFSDVEFVKCQFESSGLSITREVERRSTFRNVRLVKCVQRGCAIETAIIEDVLVDGLKTSGLLQSWGAVFKHVTLQGKIDRIMISPAVAAGLATLQQQRAFDVANATYYSSVDWALDISRGEFEECEIQRVPARLVRRDPATQVVITRERAMQGSWRNMDLSKTHWKTSLEFFLERGDSDVVLVAGKRNRKFKDLLDGLNRLRASGTAEPE